MFCWQARCAVCSKMSLFHKGPKNKLPQYVLVDRLPSSVGPRLLGRIVLDIQSPTDYYRPEDPSRDLVNETLEIVDSNFSTLFSINRNSAVEAKIGQIVGVAVDDGRSAEKKFEGRIVRTRFLTQHKDALKKLLEVRRAEIVELLSDAKKGRGYMIVGIKTAADASVSAKQASHRTTKIGVEFPVNQASAAASHGALQTAAANPQAKMDFTNDASVATSTHMDGEQIFRCAVPNCDAEAKARPGLCGLRRCKARKRRGRRVRSRREGADFRRRRHNR